MLVIELDDVGEPAIVIRGQRQPAVGKLDLRRLLTSSASTAALTDAAFKDQPFNRIVTSDKAPPGELREVWGAKYPNFLGIAAGHRFFHNPTDSVAVTGPEILEPVARGLAAAMATLSEKQREALGSEKK